MPTDIAVLVGSLRKGSFSRATARAIAELAPPSLSLEIVEIRDLPLYDADLEAALPEPWRAFRERLGRAAGVLFVTPEYNRSVPGALKNAIDVGSRPYGKSNFSGRPAGVVSVSPGALGAFGANHHLRQSLVFLDMPTMQQPEVYLGNAAKLFDAEGRLVDESARGFLTKFVTAFAEWVGRNARVPA
jgi:chromate reductase